MIFTADFFHSVWSFLVLVAEYFSNIATSIYSALLTLAVVPSFSTYLTGFVPTLLGTSIVIVVSVGIVKLILGWGNT